MQKHLNSNSSIHQDVENKVKTLQNFVTGNKNGNTTFFENNVHKMQSKITGFAKFLMDYHFIQLLITPCG